jgi:hypothetical protein
MVIPEFRHKALSANRIDIHNKNKYNYKLSRYTLTSHLGRSKISSPPCKLLRNAEHDKDTSLLKGPEFQAYVQNFQPVTGNVSIWVKNSWAGGKTVNKHTYKISLIARRIPYSLKP